MVPFNLALVVTSLVVISIHVFIRRRSRLFCFSMDASPIINSGCCPTQSYTKLQERKLMEQRSMRQQQAHMVEAFSAMQQSMQRYLQQQTELQQQQQQQNNQIMMMMMMKMIQNMKNN